MNITELRSESFAANLCLRLSIIIFSRENEEELLTFLIKHISVFILIHTGAYLGGLAPGLYGGEKFFALIFMQRTLC